MVLSDRPNAFVFRERQSVGLQVLFFILLSCLLMFLDAKLQRLDQMRRGLTVVLTPLHYTVNGPSHIFDWLKSSFTSHEQLVTENRNLRMQQLFLEAELQRFRALEKENEALRELLLASREISGKVLNARLLAVAPDPYLSEIMIDKGNHDGVFVGQPVLDAHGVMGQVTRVGPYTSRVLLITDNRSMIPVEIYRNGLRGIAAGNGYENMRLLHVPDTADVRIGDLLYTSGLGQRYPAGYPVAEIVDIERTPEQHFSTIRLKPIAHLYSSREVLLIWPTQSKLAATDAQFTQGEAQ